MKTFLNFHSVRLMYLAIPLSLVLVWTIAFGVRGPLLDHMRGSPSASSPPQATAAPDKAPAPAPDTAPAPANETYGPNAKGFQIKDKVAMITDTQYTARLIPLILHYHVVLGPDWPIVFYTSQETFDKHFDPKADTSTTSAIWRRVVDNGGIDVRIIPDRFNMTQRDGVNIYLSKPWLYEDLAPAKKILIFQADAILCANSHRTVDSFLQFDFIGAQFNRHSKVFNGGLSLRNRELILDILSEGRDWEEEVKTKKWHGGGEDVWFCDIMGKKKAKLPPFEDAMDFSLEYKWHLDIQKEPLGYHKVHKNAGDRIGEIRKWCPEIDLARSGDLK